MCFFKKRKAKKMLNQTEDHNQIIQSSLKKIKSLMVKLEEKEEIRTLLSDVFNQYSNCSANSNPATIKQDKNILSLLGDIDVSISKAVKTDDYSEIESLIKKIRVIIAER